MLDTPEAALAQVQQGKIIAYPTEAVYGLGCDPFNQRAVMSLLSLKERAKEKGLILLIADWTQLWPLISMVPLSALEAVRATWPGPVTWVFPKNPAIPDWLCGIHTGIAIRMTAHPIARVLCKNAPLVSTSANRSGHEPAKTIMEIMTQFPCGIEAIVEGALGGADKPSVIYDVLTGQQWR